MCVYIYIYIYIYCNTYIYIYIHLLFRLFLIYFIIFGENPNGIFPMLITFITLGLPIHIKILVILINTDYYILSVSNRALYIALESI